MIALISTLIFGLICGAIAKLLMPGDDPGGWIVTSLLGVAGAFLGKLISSMIGMGDDLMRWTMTGMIFSVVGAIVLLALYRLFTRGRSRTV